METSVAMANSISHPHLPPELHDRIIDLLWDDRKTLLACSLACKSFVPRSRTYIFNRILLTIANYKKFVELMDASPDIAYYPQTLEFRRLVIPSGLSEEVYAGLNRANMEMHWVHLALISLPVTLSNVVRLCFQGVPFSWQLVSLFRWRLFRVQYLFLFGCTFPALQSLSSFLRTFKFLNVVSLSDVTINAKTTSMKRMFSHDQILLLQTSLASMPGCLNDDEKRVTESVAKLDQYYPKVTEFRVLSRAAHDTIVPEIFATPLVNYMRRSLKRLCIPTIEPKDLLGIQNLLSEVGGGLKELVIGFSEEAGASWDGYHSLLDLSVCTALRSLCIQSLKLKNKRSNRVNTTGENVATDPENGDENIAGHSPTDPSPPPPRPLRLAWLPALLTSLPASPPKLCALTLQLYSAETRIRDSDYSLDFANLVDAILRLLPPMPSDSNTDDTTSNSQISPPQLDLNTLARACPCSHLSGIDKETQRSRSLELFRRLKKSKFALTLDFLVRHPLFHSAIVDLSPRLEELEKREDAVVIWQWLKDPFGNNNISNHTQAHVA